MIRPVLSSVTRISSLTPENFESLTLPRDRWQTGDYVVGQVLNTHGHMKSIELAKGRMVEVMEGDLVVGALGLRAATLEAVGSWESIDDSGRFEALTSAGLFGVTTSISPFLTPPMPLIYRGHVVQNGEKVTMHGSVKDVQTQPLEAPVIMIVGTSMSAGKTLSGRVIVHLLSQLGLNVVGAKLTGAARYRDMLSFVDAGASQVFDFVDVGLPSSVCSEQIYRKALTKLLSKIAETKPDVLVAEAGASPLEPYNGKAAMEMVQDQIRFLLLCAQDPYAVIGVQSAFDRAPDLVAGGAANTGAGIELVRKLAGLTALNLIDPSSHEQLAQMLKKSLPIE